jgi:hypothetical protein
MLIELSYWPEQVRSDRSAYGEYRTLYDKQLVLLQECVQAGGGGADAGGVGTGLSQRARRARRLGVDESRTGRAARMDASRAVGRSAGRLLARA